MLDKPPEVWSHSKRCARRQGHWEVPHGRPQNAQCASQRHWTWFQYLEGKFLKDFKHRKSGVRWAFWKASSFREEGEELTGAAWIWDGKQEVWEWSFGQHPHYKEETLRRQHHWGWRIAQRERKPREEGTSGRRQVSNTLGHRCQQLTQCWGVAKWLQGNKPTEKRGVYLKSKTQLKKRSHWYGNF